MRPKELMKRLELLVKHGESALISGPPGVGKTDIGRQVAERLGYDFLRTTPVGDEPTDYKGLPYCGADGKASFLPFGHLRQMIEATRPLLVMVDDMPQATPAVMSSLRHIILDRSVGEHRISDFVRFVACANRRKDKCAANGVPEHVKSGFCTILELEPHLDDFCEWGFLHDVHPGVIGSLQLRPELLHQFNPSPELINFPCPRTWAAASRLINIGLQDFESLKGAVGEGAATFLVGILDTIGILPTVPGILLDPSGTVVPKKPDQLWVLGSALVSRMTLNNAGNILTYAGRMPKEFSAFVVVSMVKKDGAVQHLPEFTKWALANPDILF